VGISDATAIVARYAPYTCALLAGGTVKCWGDGNPTPVAIEGIDGAIFIGGGTDHTCATVAGGVVKCWGRNTYGQLGNGTTSDTSTETPVEVVDLTGATLVTGGERHTCVRMPGGVMECWGDNSSAQLGNNSVTSSLTPMPVNLLSGARVISSGWFHTCAIVDGATAKCWGEGSLGQLGNGGNTDRHQPQTVRSFPGSSEPSLAPIIDIRAGAHHTCATLANGTTYCWGDNTYQQLGINCCGDEYVPVPVPVSGL
jgi:alpha-tubulin suppressor-like RCC1 family protein